MIMFDMVVIGLPKNCYKKTIFRVSIFSRFRFSQFCDLANLLKKVVKMFRYYRKKDKVT